MGNARLGYRVHLRTPGAHLIELHRFPTLSSLGRIRVGVGVDDLPPVVVESPTTDEKRGGWWRAVLENVEKQYLRLPYLPAGEHVVWLYAVDEYVAYSRLVVYTTPRRENALGPSTSARADAPREVAPDPAPGDDDLDALDAVRRELYRIDPADLPLPRVVYADPGFWSTDTTFKRPPSTEQDRLGAPRLTVAPDGTKDWIAALGTGPAVESGGVLAVEAERALLGTIDGYRTPSLDLPEVTWTHTQAETDGGTGLALHVDAPGRRWDDPATAPGLHVRVQVSTAGTYRVWALAKYDSRDDDSLVLALDGTPVPADRMLAGGDLYAFGTQQIWSWNHLTDLGVAAGTHTLSVLARKAGLRVDRLYLTVHDERPPADAHWPRGSRTSATPKEH